MQQQLPEYRDGFNSRVETLVEQATGDMNALCVLAYSAGPLKAATSHTLLCALN